MWFFVLKTATSTFCTHMTCKNGGTCVPFSLNEPSCSLGQISSTCCQCNWSFVMIELNELYHVF
jgi:hypothetical protein